MNWFDAFVISGTIYFATRALSWFIDLYFQLEFWWEHRKCEDCHEDGAL